MVRYGVRSGGMGGGGFDPPPKDLWVLLGIFVFTYTLKFLVPGIFQLLWLTKGVWEQGYLWQLMTYAVVPTSEGFWFLIELLMMYFFGKDVYRALGRSHFWRLLVYACLAASTLAVAVQMALSFAGLEGAYALLLLRGGSTVVFMVLIAAYSTLYPGATIRLYFILPIPARVFIWLELFIAFLLGFLPSRDLAGFLGLCTAVALTYALLTGGVGKNLREMRLRVERKILEGRLRRMQKQRNVRIRKSDDDNVHRGPWVN